MQKKRTKRSNILFVVYEKFRSIKILLCFEEAFLNRIFRCMSVLIPKLEKKNANIKRKQTKIKCQMQNSHRVFFANYKCFFQFFDF